MMSTAQIIGGDVANGSHLNLTKDDLLLVHAVTMLQELVNGNVAKVEIVNEDRRNEVLATLGAGILGTALAGPLGGVAGVMGSNTTSQVLFVCYLKDERRFLAKGDTRVFEAMLADSLNGDLSQPRNNKGDSAMVIAGDVRTYSCIQLNGTTVSCGLESLSTKVKSVTLVPLERFHVVTSENGWKTIPAKPETFYGRGFTVFLCELNDGRKFLAKGHEGIYHLLLKEANKSEAEKAHDRTVQHAQNKQQRIGCFVAIGFAIGAACLYYLTK